MKGRLKGRLHGGAIQPHTEHMSIMYKCLLSIFYLRSSPKTNPEYQNNLSIIETKHPMPIVITTSSSVLHGEMLGKAPMASHSLQPGTAANVNYQLTDDFDFDKILVDFDFTGLEGVDLTAPVPAFTFSETPRSFVPSNSASLPYYDSP
jgi:hypothetical protein